MIPTFRQDLELTADLPIGGSENHIHIAASEYSDATRPAHPGDPYLALVEPGIVDPQKVTAVTGGDLTTAVAIAQTHLKSKTRVSHLLLVCLASPVLEWDYSKPTFARCRLKFLEKPDEYVTPNADLAEPAFLYEWSEMMPTPLLSRFTSYENSISYGGQTFTPAPYSHGSIKSGIKLDREEVDIASWGGNFPTNPLAKLFPYALEGELWLKIVEVNSAAPDDGSAKVLFYGIVSKPDFTGVDWKAKVRAFGNFFERNVPRLMVQNEQRPDLFAEERREQGGLSHHRHDRRHERRQRQRRHHDRRHPAR